MIQLGLDLLLQALLEPLKRLQTKKRRGLVVKVMEEASGRFLWSVFSGKHARVAILQEPRCVLSDFEVIGEGNGHEVLRGPEGKAEVSFHCVGILTEVVTESGLIQRMGDVRRAEMSPTETDKLCPIHLGMKLHGARDAVDAAEKLIQDAVRPVVGSGVASNSFPGAAQGDFS